MIDNLSIAVNAFARCMLTSLSVDEMLLPRYVNRSVNSFQKFIILSGDVFFCLKYANSILFAFT